MKKYYLVLTAFLLLGFGYNTFAQIAWSGDLQVRPRYDIKDYGSYGGKVNDMYYMLRAGLNVKADLGNGFFGKIRLEHYNYAGYVFTSGAGTPNLPIPGSNDVIGRPTVNFTQMYFGVHKKNWGVEAGIFPISGIANPLLDIHYMPKKMIDIPFTIYRLNTLVGVYGYITAGPGKIDLFASIDKNQSYKEDITGKVLNDKHDTYSFNVDYSFKISDFWFQPDLIFTWASDSVSAPVSYGLNFATPEFSGVKVGASAAFSSQNVAGTAKYDAHLYRIKLQGKVGPGSFEVWYDIAKRTDKFTKNVIHDFTYLWLLYKIPVYKAKHGALTIIPRLRHMTEKVANTQNYARNKIEVLFVMSFK